MDLRTKIYTTLDIEAQTILENNMIKNMTVDEIQVSGIMMDPNNGNIVALIGGVDYVKSEYNQSAVYSDDDNE